jgi:arylsulfatase A-like enzyme
VSRTRAVIGAAALAAALACAPDGSGREIPRLAVHRFAPRPGEESAAGFAAIAHERRPVLRAHASLGARARSGRAGDAGTRLALPERFAGVKRVLVRAQSPAALPGPGHLARVDTSGAAHAVELPESLRGERGLEVIALPEGELEQTTAATMLPEGARLDFGFGLLEPDRRGAVEFTLAVCERERCDQAFRETLDPRSARGWQDRRLSLAAWAGRPVALRLGARRLDPSGDDFALPVWSVPVVTAPAPRPAARRSVILISLDTLRADRLDAYGRHAGTSPFLARKFGREGVIFESAVAAATTTGPSHMTVFTSLQPWVHGEGTGPRRRRIHAPTAAELLRAAGFRTAAFTENASINSRRGFARGFDEFGEDKGGVAGLPKGQIGRTLARGLAWLQRHRHEPFFLFLHTYQTHAPYAPPADYLARVPATGGSEELRRYDGEIRYVDDRMREFLNALERGGPPDPVVIVFSDHGEEFGEHGFRGHAVTLHAEITHVPLMLTGEGIPRGVRVSEPIAHVDLMPTILELAGVPVPAHAMGRSLVPLWQRRGGGGGAPPVFSETWHTSGELWRGGRAEVGAPALAVRHGARKLIRYPDPDGGVRHEYYELDSDPSESHDRYDPQRPEVAELQRLLDDYPERMESQRSRLSRSLGLEADERSDEIDAQREQKLRALGYIID